MARLSLLARRKRVTLTAQIEFGSERRGRGEFLRRGRYQEEISSGKVESVAREVITNELPTDMADLFGLDVKTRVVGVRDGSLLLFFEVLLAGYNVISDYSGFFDSIELIKSQCRRLLSMRLREEFKEDFDIGIQTTYPSVPEPGHRQFRRWMDDWPHYFFKYGHEIGFPPPPIAIKERGGFFYFSIVLNIILLIVIGILVYAAVQKTYFGP